MSHWTKSTRSTPGMLDPQSFIEKMPLVIAFLLSMAVLGGGSVVGLGSEECFRTPTGAMTLAGIVFIVPWFPL